MSIEPEKEPRELHDPEAIRNAIDLELHKGEDGKWYVCENGQMKEVA